MYVECGLERRGRRKGIYRIKAVNPGQGKRNKHFTARNVKGSLKHSKEASC
jgi:hypothetical protein